MPRTPPRAARGGTVHAAGEGEQMDIEGDKAKTAAAEAAAAAAAKTNWCTAENINKYAGLIQQNQARIDEIMDAAKVECRPYRDEISKLRKQGAETGLPKTEFDTLLRQFKLQDRIDNIDRKLDDGQKANLDMMRQAIGLLKKPASNGAGEAEAEAGEGDEPTKH